MFSRITSVIDLPRMHSSEVTVFGAGASFTLISNLVRSGLNHINLVDPQTIELANIARQDHMTDMVGKPKVEALKQHVHRISPQVQVRALVEDVCELTDEKIDALCGSSNLIIAATDHFPAQARVNEAALRLGVSALWIGLYAGAGAGEIVYRHTEVDSCFRCLCAKRYRAYDEAKKQGRSIDPSSDGADIFSIQLLDAIAGQIAVGLLTRGADNRFGRLIDQLGTGANARNFIQVKIDPAYTFAGRDIFREQLKIPETCDAYFAWNTIARSDNPALQSGCRDCALYRGHYWMAGGNGPVVLRMKPGDPGYCEREAARQRAEYLANPSGFLFV